VKKPNNRILKLKKGITGVTGACGSLNREHNEEFAPRGLPIVSEKESHSGRTVENW